MTKVKPNSEIFMMTKFSFISSKIYGYILHKVFHHFSFEIVAKNLEIRWISVQKFVSLDIHKTK